MTSLIYDITYDSYYYYTEVTPGEKYFSVDNKTNITISTDIIICKYK